MAVSALLDAYLSLERVLLEFEERGDPSADLVRDLMDPLWYRLSDEDHAQLDDRGPVSLASLHPIRLLTGAGLLYRPPPAPGAIRGMRSDGQPIEILPGWDEVVA